MHSADSFGNRSFRGGRPSGTMPLLLMMAKTTMITHDIVSRFMLTTMVMKWTSIEFLVYLLDFDTTDIIIAQTYVQVSTSTNSYPTHIASEQLLQPMRCSPLSINATDMRYHPPHRHWDLQGPSSASSAAIALSRSSSKSSNEMT